MIAALSLLVLLAAAADPAAPGGVSGAAVEPGKLAGKVTVAGLAPKLPNIPITRDMKLCGTSKPEEALEVGSGCICVLPHMGNWDVAGMWVHCLGLPIVSVAERLEPERLYRLFERHRQALGMEILPLDTGSGAGRALGQALKENKVVALVADRDLAGSGVQVEMFGKIRRMPAGPAALALRTGAPLVPCAVYSRPGGWLCVMRDPIHISTTGDRRADVTAITQALAKEFEALISVEPADWHVFQPGWA